MAVFNVFDREYTIGRLQAYQQGVSNRVFRDFDGLDQEAERLEKQLWDHAMSQPGDGSEDPSAIADHVTNQAADFLITMEWLKQQTINNACAGLYHLWEKDLKSFLERTAVRFGKLDMKRLMRADFGELSKILIEHKYDFENQASYEKMNEIRLLANSVKHGLGNSLFELIVRRPDLFRKNYFTGEIDSDAENLEITEDQFNEFAQTIAEFWEAFDITY